MANRNDNDPERSGGQQRERQHQAQRRQEGHATASDQPEQTDESSRETGGNYWYEPTTGRSGSVGVEDTDRAGQCGPDDDSDLKPEGSQK